MCVTLQRLFIWRIRLLQGKQFIENLQFEKYSVESFIVLTTKARPEPQTHALSIELLSLLFAVVVRA